MATAIEDTRGEPHPLPMFAARVLGLSDRAELRHTAGLWKSVAAKSARTPVGWVVGGAKREATHSLGKFD